MLPVTGIKGLYSRVILCDLEEEFRFLVLVLFLPFYGQWLLWCQAMEILSDTALNTIFLEDDDNRLNSFHQIQIYQFLNAVIKYHKRRGLKQHKCILLLSGCKNSSSQGVYRAMFFLQVLGENPFPSLFQLLEAIHIPGLMPLFSIFKAYLFDLCFHHCISFFCL